MEQLSPRIQDEHIKRSLKKTSKKRHPWRIVWLIVLVLVIAAGGYVWFKFMEYGQAKTSVLLEQGAAQEQSLEFAAALDTYRQAQALGLVAHEQAAQAAFRAGGIYQSKSALPEALTMYQNAFDLDGANPDYWEAAALVMFVQNDLAGLENLLESAPSAVAGSGQLETIAARVALRAGKDDVALEHLEAADEYSPALLLSGSLRLVEKKSDAIAVIKQAAPDLTRAADIGLATDLLAAAATLSGRQHVTDYLSVAVVALDNEYAGLALSQTTIVLTKDDSNRDAWVYQAAAYVELGQLDQAASSAEKAQTIDPIFGYTRYVLSQIAKMRGDTAEAIEHIRDAIMLEYDSVDVRLQLAALELNNGSLDGAEEVLLQAIADLDKPEIYEALFWFSYLDAQDLSAAEHVAQDFLDEYPRDSRAAGVSAVFEALQGDSAKALAAAEDLLSRDPFSALAYLVRGLAASEKADLLRAIDLDFNGPVARAAEERLAED